MKTHLVLSVLTLALIINGVNCQKNYGEGIGIFPTIVIYAITILVIASIAWCLARIMRSRRSIGVIRVIPATTTVIQVPQPIIQPSMHFSFETNSQQPSDQPQNQVRLPQESSNQKHFQQPPMSPGQQNQFQQQENQFQQQPWITGQQQQQQQQQQTIQQPFQQPWTSGQSCQPTQNFPPQASFDPFGSQPAFNQGYQPDAPPAYEYEEKKEVPRY